MKKIKLTYTSLLISIVIFFNSCNKNKCHEVEGPDDKSFSFRLIDPSTNETAIAAWVQNMIVMMLGLSKNQKIQLGV